MKSPATKVAFGVLLLVLAVVVGCSVLLTVRNQSPGLKAGVAIIIVLFILQGLFLLLLAWRKSRGLGGENHPKIPDEDASSVCSSIESMSQHRPPFAVSMSPADPYSNSKQIAGSNASPPILAPTSSTPLPPPYVHA